MGDDTSEQLSTPPCDTIVLFLMRSLKCSLSKVFYRGPMVFLVNIQGIDVIKLCIFFKVIIEIDWLIVVYRQVISILAIYIHDEMIIKLCKVSKSYEESKMKSYAKFEKKKIYGMVHRKVYIGY